MSALRYCDKSLRKYLLKHHLPDLFESLLTAILVNQPEDGHKFMLEKILLIQENPSMLDDLRWDSFIEEEKRPNYKRPDIDFLWSYENHDFEPTEEMYQIAYGYYNHNLLLRCYSAIFNNWQYKTQKKRILAYKLVQASKHFSVRMERIHFHIWLVWLRAEKRRQSQFVNRLQKVFDCSLKRFVFRGWHAVALDAKNTREYFEKIEKGQSLDQNEHSGEKKDHISELPKQVAINIFRHVDLPDLVNCSKVCRTWKEITQETVLWSRVDLTKVTGSTMSNKAFSSLIQKCRPFLCHLNVRACEYLMPRALKSISDCRNLQDINMSECVGITDDVIREIATGCASLLYVNVSYTEISDASLRYLSRNCSNIQYLSIAHCPNISDKGLHYLASGKGSQKLIYLDMNGLEQISPEGFRTLSKGCFRLNTIFLNDMPSLQDDCIEALMSDNRTLRCISILNSPLLTDAAVKYLCSSKKIQKIKLEGNSRMTDAAVKTLIKYTTELRHFYCVDFQRLTDMSLKSLGQCKNLIVLNVADCVRVSDTGVRYVVEGFSGPRIRELNLTNCIRVSDVSMLRISQRCHSLVYANFSYCEHISDAGVELLATLPNLTSLDLSGCHLSDQGIISLGNNVSLRDLSLSECTNVTDVGMQKLVQQCKDLYNLDLSHLKFLTDQAIKSLAFYCRRLRLLNLAGCVQITDQGLQYLCGVCHFMEHLDISGCRHVSDHALRYIRRGCRNMKTLTMLYCKGVTKYGVAKLQMKMKAAILHSQDEAPLYMNARNTMNHEDGPNTPNPDLPDIFKKSEARMV